MMGESESDSGDGWIVIVIVILVIARPGRSDGWVVGGEQWVVDSGSESVGGGREVRAMGGSSAISGRIAPGRFAPLCEIVCVYAVVAQRGSAEGEGVA